METGTRIVVYPIAYEKPWVLSRAYRCLSDGHCIAIADRIVQENVERAPQPLEMRYQTGFTVLDSCGEVAREDGTVWSVPPKTRTPERRTSGMPRGYVEITTFDARAIDDEASHLLG